MTYEYVCGTCGHQWEAEQSIKDQPLRTCAACGKDSAKRLVSGGTGFLLKGGGWYADLYSSSSSSKSASGDASKSESKPAAESSSAKEDTKPATKSGPQSSTSGSSTSSAA